MTDSSWIKKNFELINARLNFAIKTFSSNYDVPFIGSDNSISRIMNNFWNAIEYSLMGGKRIRGLLLIATVEAISKENFIYNKNALDKAKQEFLELVLDATVAIECIHAFSLVHDDMPCMDDDDLRRGRPTCHIKFDEATALLVGDALQTLAFQVLTARPTFQLIRFKLVKILATASGANGMAGGQAVDIAVAGEKINISDLEFMHSMKTGALLESAIEMGSTIADNENTKNYLKFKNFAKFLGLAFQIVDDILDATGEEKTLGKMVGRDLYLQKPNFVQLMGIKKARKYADKLLESALKSIEKSDASADPLRMLAKNLTHRIN